MKNNSSISTTRPVSSGHRKAAPLCRPYGIACPFVLIVLLILECGCLQELVRAQAIRGEPISSAPQTNSIPISNPPSSQLAGTNLPPTNWNASGATNVTSEGKADHFVTAGFDKLSGFRVEPTGDTADASGNPEQATQKINDQIPAAVKALSDKGVRTQGFMLPLQVKDGLVVDFLLLKNQMACCYGGTPGLNEWIQVRTSGKGVRPVMDEPITVFGTLHVGAIQESGYVNGIYKLDCEKIEVPPRH